MIEELMAFTRRGFLLQTVVGLAAASISRPAEAQTIQTTTQKLSGAPTTVRALLRSTWTAKWIGCPGADPYGYGVYHFRKTLDLPAKPARFVVHVSGDNRYQL